MLTRRQALKRTLQASSLVALDAAVPAFVRASAKDVKAGGDTVLVVVELDGGNDGLNTVIPFKDDEYHKARPTLGFAGDQVLRLNDSLGLNPAMPQLASLWEDGEVAIVQGVGYPNPLRTHLHSMTIWQTADPRRATLSGWLARGLEPLAAPGKGAPAVHVGGLKLPRALAGSHIGVPSVHFKKPYELRLDPSELTPAELREPDTPAQEDAAPRRLEQEVTPWRRARAKRVLVDDLVGATAPHDNPLLRFAQRSALDAYATIDDFKRVIDEYRRESDMQPNTVAGALRGTSLRADLGLVARLIDAGFGTRIFYVSTGGFDFHATQRPGHEERLREVSIAISTFFSDLAARGQAERVVLMTFSEFGRRVQENASGGTDHGAGSCLFVVGPRVRGGLVGEHPHLDDLLDGDLRSPIDFRRVYASLFEQWLGCDSGAVLGARFSQLPLLKNV